MLDATEGADASEPATAPEDAAIDADQSDTPPGERPRHAAYHAVILDPASGGHTVISHRYKIDMIKALNGVGESRVVAMFYGRRHETQQRVIF